MNQKKKSLASFYRDIRNTLDSKENRNSQRKLRSNRVVKYSEKNDVTSIFCVKKKRLISNSIPTVSPKSIVPACEKKESFQISFLMKSEEEKLKFRVKFVNILELTNFYMVYVINSGADVWEKSIKEKIELILQSNGSEERLLESICNQESQLDPIGWRKNGNCFHILDI